MNGTAWLKYIRTERLRKKGELPRFTERGVAGKTWFEMGCGWLCENEAACGYKAGERMDD